jgi:hypothetical protein
MKWLMMGIAVSMLAPMGAVADYSLEGAVPETSQIRFDVLRKGSPFGTHHLTFTRQGETLRVITDVDLAVKIGPFTPFSYSLDATEEWVNGELQSLEGKTVDNGDRFAVSARRMGDVLNVEGTKFEGDVGGDMLITSWWNPKVLKSAELISTEDGAITSLNVTRLDRETIRTRFGEIEAQRYRVESDITLDLWYDDQGHWVKCAFEARGQTIEYILAEPVSAS